MDYSEFIYTVRLYFPVLTAIFFLIKLLGGESRDRKHSLVICLICFIYFIIPEMDEGLSNEAYKIAYIQALWVVTMITGAAMMALFLLTPFDKKAFRHACILAFIILINFMLTYHYTISHSWFFCKNYDELIIIAGIMQIMVSHDGFIGSISNIVRYFRSEQNNNIRVFIPRILWVGNLQKHKESKG